MASMHIYAMNSPPLWCPSLYIVDLWSDFTHKYLITKKSVKIQLLVSINITEITVEPLIMSVYHNEKIDLWKRKT